MNIQISKKNKYLLNQQRLKLNNFLSRQDEINYLKFMIKRLENCLAEIQDIKRQIRNNNK